MSIVTKTGDQGETSLMYGRRVPKSDPRVEAYGCVDELNAGLGLARSLSHDSFITDQVLAMQKDLIVVMGELATVRQDVDRYVKDGFKLTAAEMVDRLTAVIVDLEKDKSLYPNDWVIPGANAVSAALDVMGAVWQLPGYQVLELVGFGGSGEVWRARVEATVRSSPSSACTRPTPSLASGYAARPPCCRPWRASTWCASVTW